MRRIDQRIRKLERRKKRQKGKHTAAERIYTGIVFLLLGAVLLAAGTAELVKFRDLQAQSEALKNAVVRVPGAGQLLDPDDPFNRNIDFEKLRAINPDICGWIYVPDTKIDYPVLTGETDEEYLSLDYQGKKAENGAVFTFAGADLENDGHICIFGHNLISGQMFGELKNYRNRDFAGAHETMYLYTPDRTVKCRLISVFPCRKDDGVFELDRAGDTLELEALSADLQKRSISAGNVVESPGKIFTLGTCSGQTGSADRLTVHFAAVKQKYIL